MQEKLDNYPVKNKGLQWMHMAGKELSKIKIVAFCGKIMAYFVLFLVV